MKNCNLNYFKSNGYIVLKKIVPKNNINNVFYALEELVKKTKFKNYYKKLKNKKPKENLSELLKFIKKINPPYMSKFYETVKSLHAIKFYLNENFFHILHKKIKINSLSLIDQQQILRIDVPKKNPNLTDFHQDYMNSINHKKNIKRIKGITIWCPLHKANKFYGGIEILPGSHKFGWVTSRKGKGKYKSATFSISNSKQIKKLKSRSIFTDMEAGDVLIMDTRLIHRSIDNHSNLCRFTVQYRYGLNNNLKFL